MSTIKKSGCNNKFETFANTASIVFRLLTAAFTLINYITAVAVLKFDSGSHVFLMLTSASIMHLMLIIFIEPVTYKKAKSLDIAVNILMAVCCGLIFYTFKSYTSMLIFFSSVVMVSLREPLYKSLAISFPYYFFLMISMKYGPDESINTILFGANTLILFLAVIYICHYFSGIEKEKIKQDEAIAELLSEKVGLTHKLTNKSEELEQAYWDMVETLIGVIEVRDNFTGGHSVKVCEYSVKLARKLGLCDEEVSKIMKASILHDIGKMGIPDNILLKPGALSGDEYSTIMTHPEIGCRVLAKVRGLEEILPLILYHHERVDGTGYPYGIKGDRIPLGARIIAIADAYDAMTSNRPYRKALLKKEAKKRLLEGAGSQFDPELVGKFMEVIDEDNVESIGDYRHIEAIKKHTDIV